MKKLFALVALISMGNVSLADSTDSIYFRPHVGVGVNSQQGTSMILGVDLGYRVDENWRTGLTGHYSTGAHPERDREMGGGAFVGYGMGLMENISGHLREDIEYLDIRNPMDPLPTTDPKYETETGIASTTSAGLTISIAESLAISVGYRFVVGLTNSDLGDGRSGPTLGLMIGF